MLTSTMNNKIFIAAASMTGIVALKDSNKDDFGPSDGVQQVRKAVKDKFGSIGDTCSGRSFHWDATGKDVGTGNATPDTPGAMFCCEMNGKCYYGFFKGFNMLGNSVFADEDRALFNAAAKDKNFEDLNTKWNELDGAQINDRMDKGETRNEGNLGPLIDAVKEAEGIPKDEPLVDANMHTAHWEGAYGLDDEGYVIDGVVFLNGYYVWLGGYHGTEVISEVFEDKNDELLNEDKNDEYEKLEKRRDEQIGEVQVNDRYSYGDLYKDYGKMVKKVEKQNKKDWEKYYGMDSGSWD